MTAPAVADEPFETFTADGLALGVVRRGDVHRLGLWHRAANVLLFHSDGRLYLQRRAATKDIWPDAWDVSVGEHLRPGECFEAAALRGLDEELGVRGISLTALGGVTRETFEARALGICDRELQQTFTGTWDGALALDSSEVAAVRLVDRATLVCEIARRQDRYTPWLETRLGRIGWL